MSATQAIREAIDEINDADDSAEPIIVSLERPPDGRDGALAVIRHFRDRPDLRLDYVSTTSNPYRDGDSLIETYVDDDGNEYWVDPARDFLVQMGPRADQRPAPYAPGPTDRLSVASLREIAHQAITRQMSDFTERRSRLHPLEDNHRQEVYFFRYDDFSGPVSESELPPFIQVGVRGDGKLVSFTDTLNR